MSIVSRFQNAWSAFMNRDPTVESRDIGPGYSVRPDRPRSSRGNERTIVTSIINKIALDVAGIDIFHCKLDAEGRFVEVIDSTLNSCLTLEANIDQTGRAFRQDVVQSMLDEGVVSIVPVIADRDPLQTESYKIYSMRTGRVLEWYPSHVKLEVYNERTGHREDVTLAKELVGLVENPLYSVLNQSNSVAQRLIRKLALLDMVDEQSSSGKLDMIIQLPYTIKSKARKQEADMKRAEILEQLKGPLGIAYIDSTEKVIQLNRPLENNLLKQIEYLTNMLYSQLGLTQGILDGTADEQTMLNYYSRTIEPIVSALVDEMKRKFLSKTARSQGQSIVFFRDPFKLITISNIANIADTFTRNEILTANEIRQIIGRRPSKDPKADQLINSNLNHNPGEYTTAPTEVVPEEEDSEHYEEA